MTLHLQFCHHDPVQIRLVEPPIIALSNSDDLSIWRTSDGNAVLRIGASDEIGAATIEIEAHQFRAVWTTLKRMDEGPLTDAAAEVAERIELERYR